MKHKRRIFWKGVVIGGILGSAFLVFASTGLCEPLETLSQTMEGGRGLLFMQSARTYGSSAIVIGAKALYERREYPVSWKTDNEKNNTTVGGLAVTLGLTEYLDITGSIFAYNDARPYTGSLTYGKSEGGFGSTYVGMKIRYPYEMENPVQLALKLGGMLDTSKSQIDGLDYRWTRAGTDFDASLLQTFDLGKLVSLHLEEGYTVSGSKLFDNQWVAAMGLEVRATDRISLGLEMNNRTFDGVGPQSIFQAGNNASKYRGGAAYIGDYASVMDGKADRMKDFVIIAPSVSYRLSDRMALDLGVAINVADQEDPRETVQVAVGLNFGEMLPWLADSDRDGVKDRDDSEPKTPKGYPVDQYGVSLDTDRDGVPDGRDREPNTPLGAKVDANGVGIDTDGDGVYDGIDKEPDTPKGYAVDKFGVALDADKDKVPDAKDREPNTPAGYPVDEFGVALDTDKDGVPDGRDKEPNTPEGYPVDEFGVALDTDKDGVPDGKDLEPNTPMGAPVDVFGRALKEQERMLVQEGVIRLTSVYFTTGKSVIRPESNAALNEVIEILKKYPNLKIEIQGHTDNTGSLAKNRTLSKARAQAVLDYILRKDKTIIRSNFTVAGYGPDRPIASNSTAEGRQLNRRVEFVVLNREELQKPKK